MTVRDSSTPFQSADWRTTAGILVLGTLFASLTVQTWLGQDVYASAFVSPATYHAWMLARQIPAEQVGETVLYAVPWSFGIIWTVTAVAAAGLLGAAVIRLVVPATARPAAWQAWCRGLGFAGGWLGLWSCVWLLLVLLWGETGATLMTAVVPFWAAVAVVICGESRSARSEPMSREVSQPESVPRARLNPQLACFVLLYTLVFTTLNWRLWFNLLLPHGDSAMYEEHLWNLLNGKGFRSYLDQGLFLGEHIQVVHLGLIPLYLLWPSHLLLEFCESLALACGAIPVAWMTRRHTGSRAAALAAAAAYLLYTPMQSLDIEIDLKTFRPEAFGIPLLLFTLDQLDRPQWRGFLIGIVACLTVKEDYAVILAPLGLWIAATSWNEGRQPASDSQTLAGRRWFWTGLVLCLGSVVYLWLATRVVMPWFRTGNEIHYASYFSRLGGSPEEIIRTILTRPGFVAGELLTLSTLLYALALLVPVAGLALCSPGRLAVGLPWFGILCLNELARDPRHQFHAPLVGIVFWATAAGVGQWPHIVRWWRARWQSSAVSATWSNALSIDRAARRLWLSSLATGLFFGLSPLGCTFWDPGSNWYWGKLYGPSPRGAAFAAIEPLIPQTARVASTDFVHPRFTHHERSYDYSGYARKVSGYERRVPDDTEYLVIDTTHPYSRYHTAADVPEFHESDRWELLTKPDAIFLVLKRKDRKAEP